MKDKARTAIAICPDCGLRRPVSDWYLKQQNKPGLCQKCSTKYLSHLKIRKYGVNNPHFKGGRHIINGYVEILLSPDDFFYPMAMADSCVLEHRLVMAKSLGRSLHSWEIVHHINGNRVDNSLENLQILSDIGHKQITVLETRIQHLESRVTQLEAENILLKVQSNEQTKCF